MRTKKGDMVRACYNGSASLQWKAGLSASTYRVISISSPALAVLKREGGIPFLISSWVRCAEMKEDRKQDKQ